VEHLVLDDPVKIRPQMDLQHKKMASTNNLGDVLYYTIKWSSEMFVIEAGRKGVI
jgi:hypothetical protein